jgi:glycerol-3-phosphate dehydrogenase
MDTLLSRYGTTALAIGRHRGEYTDEDRLADNDSYSLAELDYILRHEAVVHLADVILRRTTLAIRGDVTLRDLDCIAGLAARALGWDATRRVMETQSLVRRLTEINGMRLTA